MVTTDAKHVARILGELDRHLVEILVPALKDAGIGREHWQVLRLLEDGQGHPMGEISQAVGLPGPTATRVVDLLTTNMLAYRRSDPLDRRRVLVFLTDAGWQTLQHVEAHVDQRAGAALAGLTAAERQALDGFLARLAGSTAR